MTVKTEYGLYHISQIRSVIGGILMILMHALRDFDRLALGLNK